MRMNTFVRRLLGVKQLVVVDACFEAEDLVVEVKPTWREPRCGKCGRRAPRCGTQPKRRWRHLGMGALRIFFSYAPRRVCCPRCGVKGEALSWATNPGARFTPAFEELAAYLAQITDKTTVTRLLGISWRSVGRIVERIVGKRLDPSRLDGLLRIGIDEFSYRKRHRYITVVVDHDRRRVVWAGEGRGSETLGRFFDEMGEARIALLGAITMDMAGGYLKAIRERAPHAEVVFDRFHVQRLASDAIDEVRRSLVRWMEGTELGARIKGSRFALLKSPWNVTRKEGAKLREIQETNAPLYRAYLLKESLAHALDYRQPKRAEDAISEWLAWASRSKLPPFIKAAATIRKHKEGILAYVRHRLTNAVVEGFNNRLRMIARRAYGFHGAAPLISMLFLCCGGITLNPPIPGAT